MDRLRAPGGCPWDREQDHRSLRPYLLEETHEVLRALDEGDDAALREELGDLLLQIVFHARLAAERGAFDLDDVGRAVCEKIVGRHPHVFGTTRVRGTRDVLVNWERIKEREGKGRSRKKGPLSGIPEAMPALLRAFRVAEKLDRRPGAMPATAAVRRDLRLHAGRLARSRRASPRDVGGLLLAAAFLASRAGVDPESELREEILRFTRRAAPA